MYSVPNYDFLTSCGLICVAVMNTAAIAFEFFKEGGR